VRRILRPRLTQPSRYPEQRDDHYANESAHRDQNLTVNDTQGNPGNPTPLLTG
jgi:hypothetical protein